MKFGADIRNSLMMDPNDFGDPLTAPIAPSWGQLLNISTCISNGLPISLSAQYTVFTAD